ncbi:MAG: Fe-S cluster assembly protein SufB [Desulfurococcales archaeon]|nr:Fe-S cluster assembly protein SufB [Desulfurococcales archaeon]MCE4622453.1 Fe-S cluster assembly protein SufB [Desulfurococcales archaeon]MCE4627396.1 Fe-S cluster assembly protein SufB [Desulfurococcales archaeon]MCE4629231.1 Fe-S cluster assembly protein SufB [Desulfurococcales archaeon]
MNKGAIKLREELLKGMDAVDMLGLTSKPYKIEVELRGKITRDVVEEISRIKKEPDWMRRLRLRSLELFEKLPMPKWVPGIEEIDLEELAYYVKPEATIAKNWDDLPKEIREYYEKLGIPEAEARFLAGLYAVMDSETVYGRVKDALKEKGIVIMSMDEAVQKDLPILKEYFMRIFPPSDHKFAALHGALWSGGVFMYVPKGVKIPEPIEGFFLIGKAYEGQFEHTLIIADEGSYVNFIEGCSAPRFAGYSFHDGMVELYAHKNAVIKFTTVQNWSRNVINYNNKRAIAESGARVDWFEGSIGSKITVTYPSTILKGEGAVSRSMVVSLSKGPVIKDTGSKMIHLAPGTRSRIVNKTISAGGGVNIYRGLIKIIRGAKYSQADVECDSLIFDDKSKAHTYPHNQVDEPTAQVTHEATTGRLSEPQLFYLQSRGLGEDEAKSLIVLGFLSDILVELPFEYLNVLNRVIQLEFKELGSVG